MEIHWLIEEWIPARHAIGGNGYWAELLAGRFKNEAEARAAFEPLNSTRTVRFIKETREVKG